MTTRFNATFNRIPSFIRGQPNCNKSAGRRIIRDSSAPFSLEKDRKGCYPHDVLLLLCQCTSGSNWTRDCRSEPPGELHSSESQRISGGHKQSPTTPVTRNWQVLGSLLWPWGIETTDQEKKDFLKMFLVLNQNSRPTQASTHLVEHQWVHFW